jgi:hypothetical protein
MYWITSMRIGNAEFTDFTALLPDSYPDTGRDFGLVTEVTVHHSGFDADPHDDAGRLDVAWRIYNHHVYTNGWPGIGYHALCFPDGWVVVTGRLTELRYHAREGNAVGVGLCLIGNLTDRWPTDAQLAAIHHYTNEVSFERGQQLAIRAHRDWVATTCPGDWFEQWRDQGFPNPALTHPAPPPLPEPAPPAVGPGALSGTGVVVLTDAQGRPRVRVTYTMTMESMP